ncbi:MAG: DUF4160 domain-containing protein [Spirochaetes bacterium]|jgi:hypothetical protein|nr:DUF4160 domain-containing protein [Spirochaetota bacterium]
MPTISMFYGIIVRMYFAPQEHPPPHFHAYYAEHKGVVDIRRCEVVEGNLPTRQVKLVQAWAELHQEEPLADWQLVVNGEKPFSIQPLQ